MALITGAFVIVVDFISDSIVGYVKKELRDQCKNVLLEWHASLAQDSVVPRNHDLQRASKGALQEAAMALVIEQERRLGPREPLLRRMMKHFHDGLFLEVPLIHAGQRPEDQWLKKLHGAIKSESFE